MTSTPLSAVAPRPKMRWGSIIFFTATQIAALVVAPIYILKNGVQPSQLWLLFFFAMATSIAITVGYHRLYSHVSFKAHKIVHAAVLFFGAAAFEQSALKWASLHRRHHRYVDTDLDPYNIKRGFFYAHVGWILFWKQPIDYSNALDLQKNPLVMHQHKHYQYWSLGAGLLTPVLIGACLGNALEALLFSVGVRLFIVFHSTFFINSVAHTFGSRDYDKNSTARDYWLCSLLTNGEGYHNYHHRFPVDYRNGVLWHHWDPGKWTIWLLSQAGLAHNLKRTPRETIQEARRALKSEPVTVVHG